MRSTDTPRNTGLVLSARSTTPLNGWRRRMGVWMDDDVSAELRRFAPLEQERDPAEVARVDAARYLASRRSYVRGAVRGLWDAGRVLAAALLGRPYDIR